MRRKNYVIINNVNSKTINGLLIQELPSIQKPKMRVRREEIDGRNGDIITNLGYEAYDKEMLIGLYGNFNINTVSAFFNQSGTIVFSNEPSLIYNFTMIDEIDYERLGRFREAKVKFHVQPFKYYRGESLIDTEFEGQDLMSLHGEIITINSNVDTPVLLTEFGTLPVQYDEVHFFRAGKNFLPPLHPILNVKRYVLGQTEAYSSPQIYLPAGQYYLSTDYNNPNALVRIGLYHDGTETFPVSGYSQTCNGAFTISEAGYYSIYLYTNSQIGSWSSLTQWQLELGNSSTEYEEYNGHTYTFTNEHIEEPLTMNIIAGENHLYSEAPTFHILYTNREVTVNNIGNIEAKPIITMYGSGDVDLYLGRNQMLRVNIDEDYITLDFEGLNAYTGGVFKNRQVIGDMSVFMLPVGTSVIAFAGNVTAVQISKYIRYI